MDDGILKEFYDRLKLTKHLILIDCFKLFPFNILFFILLVFITFVILDKARIRSRVIISVRIERLLPFINANMLSDFLMRAFILLRFPNRTN